MQLGWFSALEQFGIEGPWAVVRAQDGLRPDPRVTLVVPDAREGWAFVRREVARRSAPWVAWLPLEGIPEEVEMGDQPPLGMGPHDAILVPGVRDSHAGGLSGLVEIIDRLLGPGGCPWDQAQTHESLKRHLVEETYEVLEAIDSGDPERLREELGDLLMQPILHAQMEARDGHWSIDDVAEAINTKLIRRHPHVFGDVSVANADEVLRNWDAIKQTERTHADRPAPSLLDGVPRELPALARALTISHRAARVGFEWPDVDAVWAKFDEEVAELKEALVGGDPAATADELGDLLFTTVNLARWLDVDPEDALRGMLERFTRRFRRMEALSPKPLRELTAGEWDELWTVAKGATGPASSG